MKKRVFAFLFAASVCLTNVGALPVYAGTGELVDSTGSVWDDETQGNDETQGVRTEYEQLESINSTTYEGDESVTVYATKTSYVKVTIPRILILGESENDETVYTGSFVVKVTGDIAGCQSVVIKPTVSNDFMEVDGKQNKTESIVKLDGKESLTIGANDLLDGAVYTANGDVTLKNVTAGIWKGGLNFNIEVIQNEQ